MELKKRFSLTLPEYITFNLYHLKNQLIAVPVIFIVLMPIVTALINLASYGNVEPMMLVAMFIISVVLGGLATLINIISLRHKAKKQYISSKAMQTESDIIINETGIRDSGEYSSTTASWPDIYKATESASSYNIYFSRLQAYVIPKRILSPDETEILRSLLSRHLPPKKVKLRY